MITRSPRGFTLIAILYISSFLIYVGFRDQRADGEGLDRQARWGICKFSALLLIVIDHFEICVHDILIGFGGAASGAPRGGGGTRRIAWLRPRLLRRRLFVQLRTDGLETALQLFSRLLDRLGVGAA